MNQAASTFLSVAFLMTGIAPLGCGWVLGLDEYEAQETTMNSTGSSGTGSARCIPAANAEPVADSCGIFVAAYGSDTSAGTKQKPVATLKIAIERAQAIKAPVYVCASEFQEAIEVPPGTVIYGGLDCNAGWLHGGGAHKTTLAPAAGTVPLRLLGGEGTTHIEDLVVKAPDVPQGSSIAAVVDGATALLVRCTLSAGMGADGEKGQTPMTDIGPPLDGANPAIKGADGQDGCLGDAAGSPGGLGKSNELCGMSIGGNGGKGTEGDGEKGSDGQPFLDPNPRGFGIGGQGAGAIQCKPGGQGDVGSPGTPGMGAAASEVGMLSSAGHSGASGQSGERGDLGQGGGGGGSGKGMAGCNGPSGGGGGSGGCGGYGGLGGTSGGASIALVSLYASLTFVEVTLVTANGGHGGEGGDGQSGAVGGLGGHGGAAVMAGTTKGCSGGEGGQGGFGGKGGGGRGGHSIGIAFRGAAPPAEGVIIQTGAPGEGGAGEGPSGGGAAGLKAAIHEFP